MPEKSSDNITAGALRMPPAAKPSISLSQILGTIVIIAWAVTWYWIQDQSTRMRIAETRNTEQGMTLGTLAQMRGDHEGRLKVLEQSITTQEATRSATAVYAADDRLLLKSVSVLVNQQDNKLQYVVNTVEKMNELIQALAKDQVVLRNRLEAADEKAAQRPKGK